MRKIKFKTAVLALTLSTLCCLNGFAAEWSKNDDGSWCYYTDDGSLAKDAWVLSGNEWFYVDEDGNLGKNQLVYDGDDIYYVDERGAMITSKWIKYDNVDYYAGEDGAFLRSTITPDGYYVNADGIWDPNVDTISNNDVDLIDIEYADDIGLVFRVYNTEFNASYTGATPILVKNESDSDITIYDSASTYGVSDSEGYIYDGLKRTTSLYELVDKKLKRRDTITIKPGKKIWIAFLIDGETTVYNKHAYFGFDFSYKNNLYSGVLTVCDWKCICTNITH